MRKQNLLKTLIALAIVSLPMANTCIAQDTKALEKESILLKKWIGPYGGVPPWRQVNPDEFTAAFDVAFERSAKEIDAIANNPEEPTFENTLVALEKAGKVLNRVQTVFDVHTSNLKVGNISDIEKVVSPKLSKHFDSITQNEKLFARIEKVYKSDEMKSLSVAKQRLAKDRYENFVRLGARLSKEDKSKLSEINAQLAGQFALFDEKILHDEENYITWINSEDQLKGLPDSIIDAMENSAKSNNAEGENKGKWCVTNTRSSMDPFLTYADDRKLREVVWNNYYSRGDNGGEYDTNELITSILSLRAKRAKLLGYETHAHWRLEPQMAAKPENALKLMLAVWPKAVARVKEEVADMQRVALAEGAGITIMPWDYRYYAEKVRKEKFDLDLTEVKITCSWKNSLKA